MCSLRPGVKQRPCCVVPNFSRMPRILEAEINQGHGAMNILHFRLCAEMGVRLEMTDYEAAFQSAQKACNIYHQAPRHVLWLSW